MIAARKRLREIVATPGATIVAPIFDPLSARIAEMIGWQTCKLSGSVGKCANLAAPDGVVFSNLSDLVDICRRITRIADLPLIVDADDGGSVLEMRRTIRELEAAGASAIEIEDNLVPLHFAESRHAEMVTTKGQVGKLRAAVASRQDQDTIIVGRTTALFVRTKPEALERIRAYSETGIDAIMLPGLGVSGLSSNPRDDIEAVRDVTDLPLFVSGLPDELSEDEGWLLANRIRLRFLPQVPFRMTVQAIYDALSSIKNGIGTDRLRDRCASSELVDDVIRRSELATWDEEYRGR
jgi:carboxyvinyl-carboxyphosphonate phosphorylmutase